MFNKFSLTFSFLAIILSACVPTGQLDTFSNYAIENNENHKIYVITDCLVTSDLDGDDKFNELSVYFNIELCQKLSVSVLEELSSKTNAELVNSGVTVGLQAGFNRYAETMNGAVVLPVYVNDIRFKDLDLKRLSVISEALSVHVYGFQERQEYVESLVGKSYQGMIDDLESHEVLLVQISGVNDITVNDNIDVADVLLNGFLALGGAKRTTYYPTSTRAIMLNSLGKVVWADVEFRAYSPISDCESKRLSRELFRHLYMNQLTEVERISCYSPDVLKGHQ